MGVINFVQQTFGVLAGGAVALAGVSFALLIAFQEKLIYVPHLPGTETRGYELDQPEAFGFRRVDEDYENLWLESGDGTKLHAWLLKHPNRDAPIVLFLQENAGNIAHRLGFARRLLVDAGVHVMLLSYRGYGESEGSPSEKGMVLDARAALSYLESRSDLGPQIFVFGRSIGGAVAIATVAELADEKRVESISGVILENTFTCMADMISKLMPFLAVLVSRGKPLHFLLRSPWNSDTRIERGLGGVPVLFITGERDEMVPPEHMYKLHSLLPNAAINPGRSSDETSCTAEDGDVGTKSSRGEAVLRSSSSTSTSSSMQSRKQFVSIKDGRHMDTWIIGRDNYWRPLRTFIATNSRR